MQPDLEPGDVIIVLQMKDHESFTREGDRLIMVHKISLTEALCGFEFTVTQLDGRELLIKNPPGNIIEPGKTSIYSEMTYVITFVILISHSLNADITFIKY